MRIKSIGSALVLLVVSAATVSAELTAITAEAQTVLTHQRGDSVIDTVESQEIYPTTQNTLPLQVFSEILDLEDAGAAVAAQFADPLTAIDTNPEEFALTMAFGSAVGSDSSFTGAATLVEKREVIFSAAEVNAPAGEAVELTGIFFLDAALAILDEAEQRDLTGARLKLNILIEQYAITADASNDDSSSEDHSPTSGEATVLLNVTLEATGGVDGAIATTSTTPNVALTTFDLGAFIPELGSLNVAATGPVQISFPYTITVGEPYQLVATVSAEGESLADGNTIALLVGTPLDSFVQVLEVVEDTSTAVASQAVIVDETPFQDAPSNGSVGGLLCPLGGLAFIGGLAGLLFAPRRRSDV